MADSNGIAPLEISLLGGLELRRDGELLALPKSRKTRALLAYLVLADRPVRRDRLCELFWDLPDDPRGALRWSLSRLRPLVNDEQQERLIADRERVRFDVAACRVDWLDLRAAADIPDDRLSALSDALEEGLFAGLDLPDCPDYQAWLTALRSEAQAFVGALQRSALPVQPLTLPDKPSIAVLPFDNMSDDPEQEYFSDGITEDLITALSRVRGFFVIARNSTFTYKGRAVQMRQVCRELGARYVIEGSVRKAGNRVRVTAQLIDAAEDNHLWAERYDRDIEDIFTLQDEIARTIVGAIEPELSEAESERARRKPPENLGAWDCYHRAVWHLLKITKDDFAEGFRWLQRATELDPGFASAFGRLASAHHGAVLLGYTEDREGSIAAAVEAGRRAVTLDSKSAVSHFGLGRAYTLNGDAEGAVTHFQMALEINPSFALAHHGLVTALGLLDRHEEAIGHADMALRLSPRDPLAWSFLQAKAHQLFHLKRYEEAAAAAEKATRQTGAGFWCWTALAASLAKLGRIEQAKAAVAVALQRNAKISLDFFRASMPLRDADKLDLYLDGLRKAGLSER